MNPKSSKQPNVTPPDEPLVKIEPAAVKDMQPNQIVTLAKDMFLDKHRCMCCEAGSESAAFLFAKKGHTMNYSSISGFSGHESFIAG